MDELHYKVIYRNGDKMPIAELYRDSQGKYVFEYLDNAKYEFPGFDIKVKKHTSDVLWEQIGFRIPNIVRDEHPGVPLEELLRLTKGQLITDHFEFELN